MKIDDYVNKALGLLWPEDSQGNRTVYLHSQNLNEDRKGKVKGWPYHGRLWLHLGSRKTVAFSWNLWTHFCGASVGIDGEDGGLKLHAALPPVSFWLCLPVPSGFFPEKLTRVFQFEFAEIRVFDWAVWWKFWTGDNWSSRTPKWRDGNFNFRDFVLGRAKYKEGDGRVQNVLIPMPEGPYEATVKMTEDAWSRPRWFTQKIRRAKVDVPQGIPHEGKGENDYDCGEDRCYGISGPAENVEDAVAMLVKSVLRDRRRYNGNVMAVYPHPSQQPKRKPPAPSGGPGGDSQAEASA